VSSSGFKINKQGIAKMMREMQREFDKHRIKVPVETDSSALPTPSTASHTTYNGPVIHIHGDRAQLAWDNHEVKQSQAHVEQVAPGYEALAQALVSTLQQLSSAGLDDDDRTTTEVTVNGVLAEVTKPEPDRGAIKRSLALIKGLLAPIALGTATGAGEGAQEWARTAIEQLGNAF